MCGWVKVCTSYVVILPLELYYLSNDNPG
jgi:hypothetical protein